MSASLTVGRLLAARPETIGLSLELVGGGGGIDRVVRSPHIQKTGLALAGFHEYLQPGRVLVLGESEIRYLDGLQPAARLETLAAAFAHDIPCVLVTSGMEPASELRRAAERHGMPLLRTGLSTPLAIARLTTFLEDALAVREVIHGVLMDILGLGVLIVGESGIGKSECALDLVVRGHRLVADDAVEMRRRGDVAIIGACPELTRHHMEVRGLGVINIRDLFGVAATRASKRVELVVQLERWDPTAEISSALRDAPDGTAAAANYDRLGLDDSFYELLGLNVPLIRMPVAPGRSLAILVEVAARNQILRARGHHAARELAARLDQTLGNPAPDIDHDAEDDAEPGGGP